MKVDVYMTDLPTKHASHFFNSLKSIGENEALSSLVTVYAPCRPLCKKGETEEQFWQRHIGNMTVRYVERLPIREAFFETPCTIGEAVTIPLTIHDQQEMRNLDVNGVQSGSIAFDESTETANISIAEEDKVALVMLGSKPPKESVIQYVNAFIENKKNASEEGNQYLFVYCGEPNSQKNQNELLQDVYEVIEARRQGNPEAFSRLRVVPFTYQDGKTIASLFHRSDEVLTKSGGSTCFELMHIEEKAREKGKQRDVHIHVEGEYAPEISVDEMIEKGAPLWEGGNIRLLLDSGMQVHITTPETFLQKIDRPQRAAKTTLEKAQEVLQAPKKIAAKKEELMKTAQVFFAQIAEENPDVVEKISGMAEQLFSLSGAKSSAQDSMPEKNEHEDLKYEEESLPPVFRPISRSIDSQATSSEASSVSRQMAMREETALITSIPKASRNLVKTNMLPTMAKGGIFELQKLQNAKEIAQIDADISPLALLGVIITEKGSIENFKTIHDRVVFGNNLFNAMVNKSDEKRKKMPKDQWDKEAKQLALLCGLDEGAFLQKTTKEVAEIVYRRADEFHISINRALSGGSVASSTTSGLSSLTTSKASSAARRVITRNEMEDLLSIGDMSEGIRSPYGQKLSPMTDDISLTTGSLSSASSANLNGTLLEDQVVDSLLTVLAIGESSQLVALKQDRIQGVSIHERWKQMNPFVFFSLALSNTTRVNLLQKMAARKSPSMLIRYTSSGSIMNKLVKVVEQHRDLMGSEEWNRQLDRFARFHGIDPNMLKQSDNTKDFVNILITNAKFIHEQRALRARAR
ncbi:MAG: hypothetical protein FJZ56_00555 [Chlamydiae bacterium]|nr:hypothetical protein [Chlamydiota bacterium]